MEAEAEVAAPEAYFVCSQTKVAVVAVVLRVEECF